MGGGGKIWKSFKVSIFDQVFLVCLLVSLKKKFKTFQKFENEARLILECWNRMKAEGMKAESLKLRA